MVPPENFAERICQCFVINDVKAFTEVFICNDQIKWIA